jgi:hypothetical protein
MQLLHALCLLLTFGLLKLIPTSDFADELQESYSRSKFGWCP